MDEPGSGLAGARVSQTNLGSLALAAQLRPAAVNLAVPAASVRGATAAGAAFAATLGSPDIRVDAVRVLDPALSKAISIIPMLTLGVPRDRMTVPISRDPEPTDGNLYEDTAGLQTLYLPRYALAIQRVSGQDQYWVSLAASDSRWSFTVRLAKSPDARLGTAAREAHELPHDLSLLLRFTVPQSGNLQKELIFDEIAADQGVVRATLYLNSLAERDELFFVLTDRTSPALLLARRSIRVGIPLPIPVATPAGSSGTATIRGTWIFDFGAGTEGTAGDVWWEQVDNTVRRLVPRGQAQLTRLGAVDFGTVSLDTLKQQRYSSEPIDGSVVVMPPPHAPTNLRVNFDRVPPVVPAAVVRIPSNQLTPGTVLAVKTNAGCYAKVKILEYGYNLVIQWQTYPADSGPAVPLFRETTRTLDDVIRLSFDRDLHRYIFSELINTDGGTHAGFKRSTAPWAGRDHSYYQETARPNVFHYLPDAFKLARRPQSPHVPLLAFQIETSADSETPTVRLDFSAFRHQDPKRLLQASIELASKVPAGLTPVFLPINVEGATFKLALPRGGANGPFQPRPGAAVSSSLGVADSMTGLPLAEFQLIWDAMADTTGNAVLFQGRIEFHVEGEGLEEIPFIGRLGDMVGDIFDVTYQVIDDAAAPGAVSVKATIRNAIESPATIKRGAVGFARDGAAVPGTVTAVRVAGSDAAVDFPILLAEGQTAELLASPSQPVPGSGPVTPVFDLTDVAVTPHLEQVLKVIALNQQPESSRRVTVTTFAEVLAKAGLTAIGVEFERGQRITLPTASGALVDSAKVRFQVLDALARSPVADRYQFRIVTPSRTGDWRASTSDSFTVTSDLLP